MFNEMSISNLMYLHTEIMFLNLVLVFSFKFSFGSVGFQSDFACFILSLLFI